MLKIVFLFFVLYSLSRTALATPSVITPMLAKSTHLNDLPANLDQYFASEKLDGIRAIWTGKILVTKTGNRIFAPGWFTKNFGNQAFEGELYTGRNQFEKTLAITMDKVPNDKQWRKVKFMLFDLPTHTGTYLERQKALIKRVNELDIVWLKVIPSYPVFGQKELLSFYQNIITNQGEGIMLNNGNMRYAEGRTDAILKLKPYQDAEATVLAHIEGEGRLKGKLGSILVSIDEDITFKIGSGFSDSEREDPPPVGSIITFRFNGKTAKGIPKFARFLHSRELER